MVRFAERSSSVRFRPLRLISCPRSSGCFREKYPGVELIIHEETTQQLLRGVEENELDLALISDATPNPRIRIENLFSEELLLCLPAGHPLVRQRVVVAAICSRKSLFSCRMVTASGAQAQRFCQTKGLRPQISCRSAQIATVLAMVQAGLGISLIPEMARQSRTGPGCCLPFARRHPASTDARSRHVPATEVKSMCTRIFTIYSGSSAEEGCAKKGKLNDYVISSC